MAHTSLEHWQYFSKWRKIWVDFKKTPTDEEFKKLKECHYKIRRK